MRMLAPLICSFVTVGILAENSSVSEKDKAKLSTWSEPDSLINWYLSNAYICDKDTSAPLSEIL